MTLEQLKSQRDALCAARYTGTLVVKAGDKQVTYKSDAEMASALAALERDITALHGKRRSKRVLTYALKGL